MTSARASLRSSVAMAMTYVVPGCRCSLPNAVVYRSRHVTGRRVWQPCGRYTRCRRRITPRRCGSVAAELAMTDVTRFNEVYSRHVRGCSCHLRRVSTSYLAVRRIQTAGAYWDIVSHFPFSAYPADRFRGLLNTVGHQLPFYSYFIC